MTKPTTATNLTSTNSKGEATGTCSCCGREGFKLSAKGGALSRHGFQRPRGWGMETGSCRGSKLTPERALVKAIEEATEFISASEALLASDMAAFTLRYLRAEMRRTKVDNFTGRLERVYRKGGVWRSERKPMAAALRELRNGELDRHEAKQAIKGQREARERQLKLAQARLDTLRAI